MKVGITGHQELGDNKTVAWLRDELFLELRKVNASMGYSCLAKGADQLFVKILIELEIPFSAVIPCRNYEETFDGKYVHQYETYKRKASEIINLEFSNPSEIAFYQAGKMVVDVSEILFCIWNSQPAKGYGGTGDIIEYAKSINRKSIILNPLTKTKSKINYGN